jgi:glutamate synthase domain-containing protein 3
MVDLEPVDDEKDERELKRLIERHREFTGSGRAEQILADWAGYLPKFVKVFPMEYRRALGKMSREDEATEREERVFM